jgi:hypothetical protein
MTLKTKTGVSTFLLKISSVSPAAPSNFVFGRWSIVPNTLWLQLYEFSRFRGIITSYGQRAVYEIQATLATKISKIKIGRIKNLDFNRQKPAETSQKMVWFKSFQRFFRIQSSFGSFGSFRNGTLKITKTSVPLPVN